MPAESHGIQRIFIRTRRKNEERSGRGVMIGREKKKFWGLLYADDIVMIAKSVIEMRSMIKRFGNF